MTLSLWHNDTIRPALLMLDASAMLLCSKLFGYSVYAWRQFDMFAYSIVPCVDSYDECSTDEVTSQCTNNANAWSAVHNCPKSCGACYW